MPFSAVSYFVIDGEQRRSVYLLTKLPAANWRFRSVCEEELVKVLND